jgi:glycosyltransferase involved in cell wall biosynthesis
LKVLILHNVRWAHYKSVLFEAIYRIKPVDMEFKVVHIAQNDISRKGMEDTDFAYNYPYDVLFDDYIELVPTHKKVWAVFKYIKEFKPDIINIGGWGVDLSITLSILFSYFSGIKIVISNESTVFDRNNKGLKEIFKKYLMHRAKAFIVFGKTSKEYLKKYGIANDKFLEENAAIVDDKAIKSQFDKFSKTEQLPEIKTKHNFIFVGRIVAVKNLDLLLNAFENIKSKIPDWGLIIVGNGDKEQKLKELIKSEANNIYHFNAVDWREIPKFYTKSDCIILPSFSEAWGLVINEAMICGLAAIVSDRCGCAEDLVQDVGLIFPTGDLEKLEEAMLKVAQNPESLAQMKANSTLKIENYKAEAVAQRIVNGLIKL